LTSKQYKIRGGKLPKVKLKELEQFAEKELDGRRGNWLILSDKKYLDNYFKNTPLISNKFDLGGYPSPFERIDYSLDFKNDGGGFTEAYTHFNRGELPVTTIKLIERGTRIWNSKHWENETKTSTKNLQKKTVNLVKKALKLKSYDTDELESRADFKI